MYPVETLNRQPALPSGALIRCMYEYLIRRAGLDVARAALGGGCETPLPGRGRFLCFPMVCTRAAGRGRERPRWQPVANKLGTCPCDVTKQYDLILRLRDTRWRCLLEGSGTCGYA
eukprot:5595979-Prymnesium_polylepis.2